MARERERERERGLVYLGALEVLFMDSSESERCLAYIRPFYIGPQRLSPWTPAAWCAPVHTRCAERVGLYWAIVDVLFMDSSESERWVYIGP